MAFKQAVVAMNGRAPSWCSHPRSVILRGSSLNRISCSSYTENQEFLRPFSSLELFHIC